MSSTRARIVLALVAQRRELGAGALGVGEPRARGVELARAAGRSRRRRARRSRRAARSIMRPAVLTFSSSRSIGSRSTDCVASHLPTSYARLRRPRVRVAYRLIRAVRASAAPRRCGSIAVSHLRVGQRALRRAEREPQRQADPAVRHALALVAIELATCTSVDGRRRRGSCHERRRQARCRRPESRCRARPTGSAAAIRRADRRRGCESASASRSSSSDVDLVAAPGSRARRRCAGSSWPTTPSDASRRRARRRRRPRSGPARGTRRVAGATSTSRQPSARAERLDDALDVEEIDGAARAAPVRRRAGARSRRRRPRALSPAAVKRVPISNSRTSRLLAAAVVRRRVDQTRAAATAAARRTSPTADSRSATMLGRVGERRGAACAR